MNDILQIEHLIHRWPNDDLPILKINEFRMHSGERVFLHGPSGSGKSTFLNIISGLQKPSFGKVQLLQSSLWALTHTQRDALRAQSLGVISQSLNLLPYLSVQENLRLMLYFADQKNDDSRIENLLTKLNLVDQRNQKVSQLSLGQQQRAAIARALVHYPALIIADEPTSALDDDNRQAFMELLLSHCEENNTAVLFVSHDLRIAQHFERIHSLHELQEEKLCS